MKVVNLLVHRSEKSNLYSLIMRQSSPAVRKRLYREVFDKVQEANDYLLSFYVNGPGERSSGGGGMSLKNNPEFVKKNLEFSHQELEELRVILMAYGRHLEPICFVPEINLLLRRVNILNSKVDFILNNKKSDEE